MRHGVHTIEGSAQPRIAHVGHHELDPQTCQLLTCGRAPVTMHVGAEGVDDPHLMPISDKFTGHVPADEAGAPGDDDAHGSHPDIAWVPAGRPGGCGPLTAWTEP